MSSDIWSKAHQVDHTSQENFELFEADPAGFFESLLYTLPVNINGYVPFLINTLDTIVRVSD